MTGVTHIIIHPRRIKNKPVTMSASEANKLSDNCSPRKITPSITPNTGIKFSPVANTDTPIV